MKRTDAQDTLRILLGSGARGQEPLDPLEWKRIKARVAWVRETVAALRDAHQRVNAAWGRMFDALPDDIDDEELEAMNLPDPPEQAEVDALHAALDAVIKKDRWPPHLYFGAL
jgi:hypothetical protein